MARVIIVVVILFAASWGAEMQTGKMSRNMIKSHHKCHHVLDQNVNFFENVKPVLYTNTIFGNVFFLIEPRRRTCETATNVVLHVTLLLFYLAMEIRSYVCYHEYNYNNATKVSKSGDLITNLFTTAMVVVTASYYFALRNQYRQLLVDISDVTIRTKPSFSLLQLLIISVVYMIFVVVFNGYFVFESVFLDSYQAMCSVVYAYLYEFLDSLAMHVVAGELRVGFGVVNARLANVIFLLPLTLHRKVALKTQLKREISQVTQAVALYGKVLKLAALFEKIFIPSVVLNLLKNFSMCISCVYFAASDIRSMMLGIEVDLVLFGCNKIILIMATLQVYVRIKIWADIGNEVSSRRDEN